MNHNQHVTDKLQELLTVYENNGEKWRAMSTSKAIQAIKKHPKEITTLEVCLCVYVCVCLYGCECVCMWVWSQIDSLTS